MDNDLEGVVGGETPDEQAQSAANTDEDARKDGIYREAVMAMRGVKNAGLQRKAIELFRTIPGWRDADEMIGVCEERIKAITEKEESERAAADTAAKKRRKTVVIALSALAACAVFAVLLFTVILPSVRYGKAVKLYRAGRFDEAAAAFEAMNGYRDSEAMIKECGYGAAEALLSAGKYEEAIAAFEALNGYRDSAEKIEECRQAFAEQRYAAAIELLNAGKYGEAYPALRALGDYRDCDRRAKEIYEDYKAYILQNANVGDYVLFGAYEQDNDLTDGKEDIEWLVLVKEEDKLLLISRYALDFKQFSCSPYPVSWDTCSLRHWLNNDFLADAFSEEELGMIQESVVRADKDSNGTVRPGKGATDMVFILSHSEAFKYFDSDEARKCAATDYAIAQGAGTSESDTVDGRATCWWWLRIYVESDYNAACINIDGAVYYLDLDLYLAYNSVRPAIWIKTGGD